MAREIDKKRSFVIGEVPGVWGGVRVVSVVVLRDCGAYSRYGVLRIPHPAESVISVKNSVSV